jgi:hypothetical protein
MSNSFSGMFHPTSIALLSLAPGRTVYSIMASDQPTPGMLAILNRKKFKRWPPGLKRQCRRLFIQGEVGSLEELTRQFGIPTDTLQNWNKRGKWVAARKLFILEADEKDRKANLPAFTQEQPDKEAQVSRLTALLRAIEEQMNGGELKQLPGADVLAKLAQAHDRLFRAWQVLTGTQNPGNRKPTRADRKPLVTLPAPQGIVVSLPAPVQDPVSPSDSTSANNV